MGKTGHLTVEELTGIIKNARPDYFVETGTYLGDSTLEASKVFKHVHTIEIVPELREKAMEKCKNSDNITFHQGDTVLLLPEIVKSLKEHCCVWFLDAHQSGHDTSNNGTWVPLLTELEIILDNIDTTLRHVFIIDDVRLFSAHWDWANISLQSIEKCFKDRYISVSSKSVLNDRFILHL
jgi:hypothetical protein